MICVECRFAGDAAKFIRQGEQINLTYVFLGHQACKGCVCHHVVDLRRPGHEESIFRPVDYPSTGYPRYVENPEDIAAIRAAK